MLANESKLRGRIVEKGYTLTSLAKKIGLSRQSLRSKIKGLIDFKASEIMAICEALDISYNEVGLYFFYHESPHYGNI